MHRQHLDVLFSPRAILLFARTTLECCALRQCLFALNCSWPVLVTRTTLKKTICAAGRCDLRCLFFARWKAALKRNTYKLSVFVARVLCAAAPPASPAVSGGATLAQSLSPTCAALWCVRRASRSPNFAPRAAGAAVDAGAALCAHSRHKVSRRASFPCGYRTPAARALEVGARHAPHRTVGLRGAVDWRALLPCR